MSSLAVRHGEPTDTLLPADNAGRSEPGPHGASARVAITANPAASPPDRTQAARAGPLSTAATSSPASTRSMVGFTAAPRPASAPAAVHTANCRPSPPPRPPRGPARVATPRRPRQNTATAATANTVAWLSTCAAATSTWSSSGLHVQSTAARNWPARPPRASRCRSRPVAPNAATFSSDSTSTVSRTDVPPASEASPCSPEARLPYTDGLPRQSWTARATGSPSRASKAGVSVYGSCPVTTIRPYAA